MLLLIIVLIFGSAALFGYAMLPVFQQKYASMQEVKAVEAASTLDEMYIWISQNKLTLFYVFSPVILSAIGFIIFKNKLALLPGLFIGLLLPSVVLKSMEKARKRKFHVQLIDALLNISQSMKAGLSFLQSLEVMVDELPAPISQEFSLILKENKMGKSLEDSFERLNKKMLIEDLNMMTTAILVARETGGNLAEVFGHLADTIRQKHRIGDQVKTLTTQARWQGVILSILPFAFASFMFKTNKDYFQIMMSDPVGRLLLAWCVVSWIIGSVAIHKLSKVEV